MQMDVKKLNKLYNCEKSLPNKVTTVIPDVDGSSTGSGGQTSHYLYKTLIFTYIIW